MFVFVVVAFTLFLEIWIDKWCRGKFAVPSSVVTEGLIEFGVF